jgi:hypothetical protein
MRKAHTVDADPRRGVVVVVVTVPEVARRRWAAPVGDGRSSVDAAAAVAIIISRLFFVLSFLFIYY